MIAALYVQTDGAYFNIDDVDPWDEQRDARSYGGPHPVVAHPPCNTWCQLAPVNQARWGKMVGDDGGTFSAALAAVRRFGGVLEHPAYSIAWERFGLPTPIRGGWCQKLGDPGMSTEVSQSAYGHKARKRTWLYVVGADPIDLDWRDIPGESVIGAGVNSGECVGRPKLGPREASATPAAFKEVLLRLAASAHGYVEGTAG